jgi:hypothetical protein
MGIVSIGHVWFVMFCQNGKYETANAYQHDEYIYGVVADHKI